MWTNKTGSSRSGESAEAAPCCKEQAALGLQAEGVGLGVHSFRRSRGCRRNGRVGGHLIPAPGARGTPMTAHHVVCLSLQLSEPV